METSLGFSYNNNIWQQYQKKKSFFGTINDWLFSTRCCIIKVDFGLNIVKSNVQKGENYVKRSSR